MNTSPAGTSRKARRSAGPRRSPVAHEAILTAAADLVAEQGFAAATIEAIARRAGAGKQTVYRWWPTRAALFIETYRMLVPPERLQGLPSGDPAADLEVILGRLFRLFERTSAPVILAGLLAAAAEDETVAEALRNDLMTGRREVFAAPFQAAIAQRLLAEQFDIDAAVETVTALVWQRLLLSREPPDGSFGRNVARRAIAIGLAGTGVSRSGPTP